MEGRHEPSARIRAVAESVPETVSQRQPEPRIGSTLYHGLYCGPTTPQFPLVWNLSTSSNSRIPGRPKRQWTYDVRD